MKKSTSLWYFTGAFFVLNLTLFISDRLNEKTLLLLSDLFPVICSLVTIVCLYAAFRSFASYDFTKKAWLLIFIGNLLYFFAESTYAILELVFHYDMDETFPSYADYFWCLGYIPLIWGLLMLITGYIKSGFPLGNIRLYVLLGIIFLAISTAVFYYVLLPIINDPETTGVQFFFSIFYPIADVLIVIPAAILMYVTSLFGKGSLPIPWRLLCLGFFGFTIADLAYSYLVWQGLYGGGSYIDLLWNTGYLLIGLSGLYQKELVESLTRRG